MRRQLNCVLAISLLLMILPLSLYANEISLASWNIRILSDNSRSDSELKEIASIIKRYDIVAIQEVRDTNVLDRLQHILGEEWNYIASEPVGRGVKELYAFLYRQDVITPLSPVCTLQDPYDVFIRDPAIASFSAASFDFTLVSIHVVFGDSASDRRAEISYLDDVVELVNTQNGSEQDVILLGDFNMNAEDPSWEMTGYKNIIQPYQLTTITDTSSYDNIWLPCDDTYESEFIHAVEIYKFDEIAFSDNDALASLTCSDHRPIAARFSDTDDDLPGIWVGTDYIFIPDGKEELTPLKTKNSLYISKVITAPTDQESIYLHNPTSSPIDIDNWTIGDRNNPRAYHFRDMIVAPYTTIVLTHKRLNFQINNRDEKLYLYDSSGNLIDSWHDD